MNITLVQGANPPLLSSWFYTRPVVHINSKFTDLHETKQVQQWEMEYGTKRIVSIWHRVALIRLAWLSVTCGEKKYLPVEFDNSNSSDSIDLYDLLCDSNLQKSYLMWFSWFACSKVMLVNKKEITICFFF